MNAKQAPEPEQLPFLVYGTLRKGQSNHALLEGRTTHTGTIRLPGFQMRAHRTGAFPWLAPIGGGSVTVEVHTAHPEEYDDVLQSLDYLEGYTGERNSIDNMYERKRVAFIDEDLVLRQGWLYVASAFMWEHVVRDLPVVRSGDWSSFIHQRAVKRPLRS